MAQVQLKPGLLNLALILPALSITWAVIGI